MAFRLAKLFLCHKGHVLPWGSAKPLKPHHPRFMLNWPFFKTSCKHSSSGSSEQVGSMPGLSHAQFSQWRLLFLSSLPVPDSHGDLAGNNKCPWWFLCKALISLTLVAQMMQLLSPGEMGGSSTQFSMSSPQTDVIFPQTHSRLSKAVTGTFVAFLKLCFYFK